MHAPGVELWTDTKWDIQQTIRRHLTTDREDFIEVLEITIDLDEGNKEWMYKSFFFPKTKVPAEVVDLWKKKMMDKANTPKLFTTWPHAWICGYQCHDTKPKIRLIRFLTKGDHMDKTDFVEVG